MGGDMKDKKQFMMDAHEMHVDYITENDQTLTYDEAQTLAWEQGLDGLLDFLDADINKKSELASKLRGAL